MEKSHYDVIIATPGETIDAGYVRSLSKTIEELNRRGISSIWINEYSSLVHMAREHTFDAAYLFNGDPNKIDYTCKGPLRDAVTYKKIFCIDSDITWEVEDFFKLYDSDFDIVSGTYLMPDGRPAILPTNLDELIGKDLSNVTDVVEAEKFGMGFLAIKTGVLESIPRPWFKMLTDFVIQSDGTEVEITIGEDISWCRRAKEAGYKLYWDIGVKVKHAKLLYLG